MELKPGVTVSGVCPEIVLAMLVAEHIIRSYGSSFMVTSVTDGKHMEGSLHYLGRAFDVRTSNILEASRSVCRARLQQALGAEFDVVLEADHIHVEHDPKTTHIIMQQGAS